MKRLLRALHAALLLTLGAAAIWICLVLVAS
jgi:hypothetical protein